MPRPAARSLPQLATPLDELPDALQLKVRYLRPRREIEIQVTVSAATADDLTRLTIHALTPTAGDSTAVDQPCFVCPRQDSNLRPSA